MKKIFIIILALVLALSLGVTALAIEGSSGSSVDTFDPALEITTSDDGKTITVKMNELPEGLSAELVIPCDGWSGAVVKDSSGSTVASTFGEVDVDPSEEITQTVKAVTFEAVGGKYTITKVDASSTPSTTPSSSGSSYYSDLNEFWRDVEDKIEKAKAGETVEVELGKTDKLAWFVIDALRSNPDVSLRLTRNGKAIVEIPAGKAIANEAGRVYYSIDDLAELYSKYPEGNIPAEELPEAIPVPEEEPEQPEEPSADLPEQEPEEEPAEPEQPVVEETEEEASRGSAKGVVIGVAAVAVIALAAILAIIFKKKQ